MAYIHIESKGASMKINKLQLVLSAVSIASLLVMVAGDNTSSIISVTLCGFVSGVRNIVGILAVALFLIGGVLYAVSHFLPSSLDFKKSLTSWSTAMIVGGIIGLIIVLLAQPLVSLLTGIGSSIGGTSNIAITC